MRFYTETHKHHCGIDLHARTMYVCILDHEGRVLLHQNMPCDPQRFLRTVAPYRDDLVVAVECIFTWYWLAELCARWAPEGPEWPGKSAANRLEIGGPMRSKRLLVLWCAVQMMLLLAACNTVPLLEPQPLAGTGSLEENRAAILRGMAVHRWERVSDEPGRIVARLVARRHMAEVTISYDADAIEITYRDSEELLCKPLGESCSEIHRAYNRWIVQLRKDISAELLRASVPPI
jgi:hypothetical protein